MERDSMTKKYRVILIMVSAVTVILIITTLLQYRHISRLENELDKFYPAENRSETNTDTIPRGKNFDNTSPEKNRSTDADNDCQERIKKLESKIADMQAWQDYLEKTMEKEKSGETALNDRLRKELKPALSSHFGPFFEENNLSADKKSEFIELFIERELEIKEARSSNVNLDDFQKEREEIEANYNSLMTNLLSEEEYAAYQEYEETEQDRRFIKNFEMSVLTDDIKLNKQQEKDLVSAVYNKRRVIEETYGMSELRTQRRSPRSKEEMRKMLEAEKKITTAYLEEGKKILTEPQMKKYKEFIDLRMSQIEMAENQINQMADELISDKDKDKEHDDSE